jgi:hypothetical protein
VHLLCPHIHHAQIVSFLRALKFKVLHFRYDPHARLQQLILELFQHFLHILPHALELLHQSPHVVPQLFQIYALLVALPVESDLLFVSPTREGTLFLPA